MKQLAFALIGLLLTGCTVTSFHPKIEPSKSTSLWKYGKPVLVDSLYQVTLFLHWEKSSEQYNLFWVRAQNRGERAFEINPMDFSITVKDHKIRHDYQKLHPMSANAVAPETVLEGYDNQILELNKKIKASLTSDGVMLGLDLLLGLASIASDNRESVESRERERASDARYYDSRSDTRQGWMNDIQHLKNQKEDMDRQLLKMHTLGPGETIGGYVFFPRTDQAQEMEINYEPPQGGNLRFYWKQEIKKVEF